MGSLRSLHGEDKRFKREHPTRPEFNGLHLKTPEFLVVTRQATVRFNVEELTGPEIARSKLAHWFKPKNFCLRARIMRNGLTYSETDMSLILDAPVKTKQKLEDILWTWKDLVCREPMKWRNITGFHGRWFFERPYREDILGMALERIY